MEGVIHWDEMPTDSMEALWHPYILAGAVTLLQGDGSSGKSFMSQAIIAALTTGQALPNAMAMPPCNVVIQNAENSNRKITRPRLKELGADLSRIKSLDEENERLSLTSPKIEEIIKHYDARLFVADPIQGYMDMYNLKVVRSTLMHLMKVAERTGCAILCIGHLTKSQGKSQYRGLGSQDIYNAIPSVLNLGKVDDGTRVMVHNKSNFFDTGVPIAFSLQGGFHWLGEYDITLDELLAGEKSSGRDRQRTAAKEFLSEELANGQVYVNELFAMAEKLGIKMKTLRRAKSDLGIKALQLADGWVWTFE